MQTDNHIKLKLRFAKLKLVGASISYSLPLHFYPTSARPKVLAASLNWRIISYARTSGGIWSGVIYAATARQNSAIPKMIKTSTDFALTTKRRPAAKHLNYQDLDVYFKS